jgi:hypothetical protein
MVSLAPSCQFFRCVNNSKPKKPVFAKKAKFREKSKIPRKKQKIFNFP